jgi:hypothetical protein
MIGIKIAAIALTGLGSATMGSSVYLVSHARSALHASWPVSAPVYAPVVSVEPRAGPDVAAPEVAAPESPEPDSVLTLKQVTIRSTPAGNATRVAESPQAEAPKISAMCSDRGFPERGPAARGIWTVCIPNSLSIWTP